MQFVNLKTLCLFVALALTATAIISVYDRSYKGRLFGQVVYKTGEPATDAIVTLEYLTGYKFRLPMEESSGFGWAWKTVVKTNSDGFYPIPALPEKATPSWRFRVTVSPKIYVASETEYVDKKKSLTVIEKDETAPVGSVATYGAAPSSLVVIPKLVDLSNEEDLKSRLVYLSHVLNAAPDPAVDPSYRDYQWSDRDILIEAMRVEVAILCSFWKPEYHPRTWQGKRTALPLLCQRVLDKGD